MLQPQVEVLPAGASCPGQPGLVTCTRLPSGKSFRDSTASGRNADLLMINIYCLLLLLISISLCIWIAESVTIKGPGDRHGSPRSPRVLAWTAYHLEAVNLETAKLEARAPWVKPWRLRTAGRPGLVPVRRGAVIASGCFTVLGLPPSSRGADANAPLLLRELMAAPGAAPASSPVTNMPAASRASCLTAPARAPIAQSALG